MEHVNDWCFRDIYKGGLWDDDLHVCARIRFLIGTTVVPIRILIRTTAQSILGWLGCRHNMAFSRKWYEK